MINIPVLLFAAGVNSRLFPLNTSVHKSGLTLVGDTLIGRTLKNLHSHGFKEILLVVSDRDQTKEQIVSYLQTANLDLDVTFINQPQADGMGDALLKTASHLQSRFAIVFPYYTQAGKILTTALQQATELVVCSTSTTEPWNYGILTVANGLATSLVEKPEKGTPSSNQKIQGVYVLNTNFLTFLKAEPPSQYSFESALNKLMAEQPVTALEIEGVPTLKYPWHLFDVQKQLFTSLSSRTASSAKVAHTAIIDDTKGPVVIDDEAEIGDFVKIIGPTYIGKKAFIGDYTFVRESTIETECQVGAKTEVVRSILMPHSTIHFGYISDSIVGAGTKIGAGFITANKRIDRQDVTVTVKGQKVSSNRRCLGVVIGEQATVGINVSTMPGVCIGSNATIFPGQVVYTNVSPNEVVKKDEDSSCQCHC